MDPELIASICHEANRAYSWAIGDRSITHWENAPDWQRISAVRGVEGILNGTIHSAESAHESWLEEKREGGWKYGPVKDADLLEHPAYMAYDLLPLQQKRKDALFFAIVNALKD